MYFKILVTEVTRPDGLRASSSLVRFLQLRQHAEILQRRRIPFHFPTAGEFFQQSPHDFSAARFWQRIGESNLIRLGETADLPGDAVDEFLLQLLRRPLSALERDERRDALPL